jgi:hypothetical protein
MTPNFQGNGVTPCSTFCSFLAMPRSVQGVQKRYPSPKIPLKTTENGFGHHPSGISNPNSGIKRKTGVKCVWYPWNGSIALTVVDFGLFVYLTF